MQKDATIRFARSKDANAIAALHTANWRDAYRGIMPDEYLDGPLAAEMQLAWTGKLADMAAGNSAVLVAEEGGALAGFIRIVPNADPRWGHYIDNLHIALGTRGGGLGRKLFNAGADWAAEWAKGRDGTQGLYLFVYADNGAARAAYARWQGKEVEEFLDDAPHGGKIPAVRVAWDAVS
ncbi:MAG TPA: GNAT family N-acetyltransferase [Pedomonas sp.]|uniref:GNAT family N-acetyltransferase n=1 Tax=Pedomonas sp. TaxID=2976421 RepID=UPI002F3E9AA9